MTTASINYSSLPNRRIEQAVSIDYDSDIKTARDIILSVIDAHPKIIKTPNPVVRVTDLGDNAVVLTLYAWTDNVNWWATQCEILEKIKYGFDAGGIDMPFPQRTVHIKSVPPLGVSDISKN